MAECVLPHINEKAPSIVSVDNIDILQPHAFVSCTDATRSWHGTSVQYMQALPVSGLLEEGNKNALQPGNSQKHPATSPTASPVPVERNKRRRRTQTEFHSPHTTLTARHITNPQVFHSVSYNRIGAPSLHLDDFRPDPNEIKSMKTFQEDVFKCMLLKGAQHCLPGLRSLLNCVRKQISSTEE